MKKIAIIMALMSFSILGKAQIGFQIFGNSSFPLGDTKEMVQNGWGTTYGIFFGKLSINSGYMKYRENEVSPDSKVSMKYTPIFAEYNQPFWGETLYFGLEVGGASFKTTTTLQGVSETDKSFKFLASPKLGANLGLVDFYTKYTFLGGEHFFTTGIGIRIAIL